MAVISACDSTDDWSGTDLSIDTTDKMEGTGSLKDTVADPSNTTTYTTTYTGTWNWLTKKHILFWLKSNLIDTAFTTPRLYIYEGAKYRYWDLTFLAGKWTSIKKLLLSGDGDGGTSPSLASIDSIRVSFTTKNTTTFYKKIDNVWVSNLPYDTGFTMTMDMKL